MVEIIFHTLDLNLLKNFVKTEATNENMRIFIKTDQCFLNGQSGLNHIVRD